MIPASLPQDYSNRELELSSNSDCLLSSHTPWIGKMMYVIPSLLILVVLSANATSNMLYALVEVPLNESSSTEGSSPSGPGLTSAGCWRPFPLSVLFSEPPMFPVEEVFLSLDPVFFGFLDPPFFEPEVWDRFDDFLSDSITGLLIASRRVVED